ncbi:D12 class N6 adenine-specific DNA methyltransferase [Candidatus Magnetoovum chiemensis]|nr:D12 class N6 adenine-specific DNA methyltransferase [Candidatus Magnetoovum chiemensis]
MNIEEEYIEERNNLNDFQQTLLFESVKESKENIMRFIGCKENLLPFIETFIKERDIKGDIFCDLFAGTASVGKRFKQLGYKIISSDLLYFSYVLQKVSLELNEFPKFEELLKYLEIDPSKTTLFSTDSQNAQEIIRYLNELEGKEGFIYKNYSDEGTIKSQYHRMYFTGENAKKIDAIRETIEQWKAQELINEQEYYFLVCAITEAAPFVANISGTYAAFLKYWDKRAFKKLTLELPTIIKTSQNHKVFNIDGADLVSQLGLIDILYLDPPYNERQYAPNYHILETIAKWDNPVIRGKTGMREYEDQKSAFCNVKSGLEALEKILKNAQFKHLILSYNDEGIIAENEIINLFKKYGRVEIIEQNYQRFKSHSNGNQKDGVKEKLYYLKVINSKNELNDHGGAEWLYFLNSVEVTNYSTKGKEGYAHHLRKQHPSPKPPQLMRKLIEFFTKDGQLVFDPFMGAGSTLLACSLAGRKGIGIDLSKDYVLLYKEVCKELNLAEQKAIIGNSLEFEELIPENTKFDFILTDPPYGEMLSNKRTGERKKKNGIAEATPFTESNLDLGNMTREEFLSSLLKIIDKSCKFLKKKGYLAVFVKDLQPKNKDHNMLHCYITNKLLEIPDLSFRGYKIWYDTTQKLYPFGYPHAFVANQFHQYILIFRKEK